ncbi:hypothetical protein WG909_13050 [Peptostreptococcaceae bacterium AGR-M142]
MNNLNVNLVKERSIVKALYRVELTKDYFPFEKGDKGWLEYDYVSKNLLVEMDTPVKYAPTLTSYRITHPVLPFVKLKGIKQFNRKIMKMIKRIDASNEDKLKYIAKHFFIFYSPSCWDEINKKRTINFLNPVLNLIRKNKLDQSVKTLNKIIKHLKKTERRNLNE